MSRLALFLVLLFAGCARAPLESPTTAVSDPDPGCTLLVDLNNLTAPDPAVVAGVEFLVKQQSPDGAWRSDLYATFKAGPALTPLVVVALQEADQPGSQPAAARKGSEYLASLVNPDGTITGGDGDLDYPVYTAALSVVALSHPDNKDLLKARDAWLKYLLDRQLLGELGWKPDDKQYGGWGYCRLVPRKPEPGKIAPPLIESNLSATVFALEALRAAGVKDKERYESAAIFVRRCQNYSGFYPLLWQRESPPFTIPNHQDGGFFFIYDDPVRNKAGAVDPPPNNEPAFHSYGSTTADGTRALHLCGSPDDGHRVWAGYEYLTKFFRADTHPGNYVAAHERNREAVYYYYAASAAKTRRLIDPKNAPWVVNLNQPPYTPNWAADLAAELAKRQRPDGSWANPADLVRENEPLVATANAVIALANCRRGG
jgi:squalene-hopene/tetraprenyl-beta-curcumene cyclase